MIFELERKRPVGRTKKMWRQVLEEDKSVLNISEEIAGERPVETTHEPFNPIDLGRGHKMLMMMMMMVEILFYFLRHFMLPDPCLE